MAEMNKTWLPCPCANIHHCNSAMQKKKKIKIFFFKNGVHNITNHPTQMEKQKLSTATIGKFSQLISPDHILPICIHKNQIYNPPILPLQFQ